MATREIELSASDGWVDLAATADPDLVDGVDYQVTFEQHSRCLIRLQAAQPASTLHYGHPVVSGPIPYFFTVPEGSDKVWVRCIGLNDVVLIVSPTEEES